jgi:Ca-activated chloride channel family protein
MKSSEGPSLILTPHRAGVVAGEAVDLDVLVRVQAPDAPPERRSERAPLHLALVIDRSGSMRGRPLEEAKRCATEVVERLSPRDRVAIVTYDDTVEIVHPARPVDDPTHLRGVIGAIRSGGSTALHGGWVAAAQQLLPWVRPDVLSRVLLLSDGQANHGLTDPNAIAVQAAELAASGVSTSTYGLGHNFNEELMTAMARAGEGRAWYGETADDLREPFAGELALLDALWAKRVTLRATALPGLELSMRNDYASVAPFAWRLPSIAYGSEAWAIVNVRGPAPGGASLELLRVAVAYENMQGRPFELQVPALVLPVLARSAWQALGVDSLVARRGVEIAAARLQEDARAAAGCGDWPRVDALLVEVRGLAAQHPWLAGMVTELEALACLRDEMRFRKETHFASHSLRGRLAAKREAAGIADEGDLPEYLRRKTRQGKMTTPR